MSVSLAPCNELLMPGVALRSGEDFVHVNFSSPMRALSSAVLNGGFCEASDFINVRVPKTQTSLLEEPALSLRKRSDQLRCGDMTVGMMTAASIKSLRVESDLIEGEVLAVLVTCGLANARRAGDLAEQRSLHTVPFEAGTINVAVCTSISLADEALVEIITIAVEAKVAVLHELGITSAISSGLATGTGTDAIAVFSSKGDDPIQFAGKHTLLGERLAVVLMRALRSSIEYDKECLA